MARLIESSWLVALIVVPLFFNLHSARIFEGDKIPLLRSIALLMLAALLVRGLDDRRRAWNARARWFWRAPLVTPALVLTATYAIATVFSVAPRLSWWGSYERTQGLYTWLAYVTTFGAIVMLVRERAQRDLAVTVLLLTSVPMAVYTIVQHFGADPIHWSIDVTTRAHGTTGNAIFLSGFMIMVAPLTLVRLIEEVDGIRARRDCASVVRLNIYLLTLAGQVLAIVYSNSRGPMIGFGCAMMFFGALLARQRGARWLSVTILTVAFTGALLLATLAIGRGPVSPLRQFRAIDSLADRLAADQGTARVRTLIWEGATQLLAAHPFRAVTGYGPETFLLVFPPFYPAELSHYETLRAYPDRAHNEVFDTLVATGVVGCGAEIGLVIAFLGFAFGSMGVIRGRVQRRSFLAAAVIGGVLGAVLPFAAEGSFRFAGLGVAAGIIGGAALYLLIEALVSHNEIERSPDRLLLLGLLAAVVAHFVEIQFGIAVSFTRLLFWVSFGLAVTLACPPERAELEEDRSSALDPIRLGIFSGLIAIVLTFDFYTFGFSLRTNAAEIPVVLSAWLVGAVLASAVADRSWFVRLRDYAVVSIGLWFAFAIVLHQWMGWRPVTSGFQLTQVLPIAEHTANAVTVLYGTVAAVLVLSAVATAPRMQVAAGGGFRRSRLRLAMYAVLLLATVPLIVTTNLNLSRADVFSRQAETYLGQRRLDAARLVVEEALRLEPRIDHYMAQVGTIMMELARTTPAAQREPYLTNALTLLLRAAETNPLNMDNVRNLARLHHLWATLATDAAEQTRHYDQAERHFEQATALSPNNTSVWNEWALLCIERGQVDHALGLIERSLQIDDRPTARWIRGNVYLARGAFELALADYQRAVQVDPKLLAAWSGMGLALTRLGRLDEAIGANRRALRISPGDMISHRNLALLYQQTGRLTLALTEAQDALAVAEAADQPALNELIAQLQAQQRAVSQ